MKGRGTELWVFDSGSKKMKKYLEESEASASCEMRYLETVQLQGMKQSYEAVLQCFMNSKKSFIKDLLSSRWYDGVLQYLKGAS
jgi:hypothetical protein